MTDDLVWLLAGLPLGAFLIIALVTRGRPHLSAAVSILAVLGSFALSALTFAAVAGGSRPSVLFSWVPLPALPPAMPSGPMAINLPFAVDPLSAVMLIVVTSVSLLVQVYSTGYMRDEHGLDPGYARYYAMLSLFTFAMLGLVLAGSLVAVFVFWELVGLCSYLLIGHWHERPAAADAAKKAFLVTRLGDVGFLLGIIYLYAQTGTFEFVQLTSLAAAGALADPVLAGGLLLLFCGAIGKSAQFPLHVWLPDAMEGPTPVSALIHAATMVAAGVYLMARTFPLLEHSAVALAAVAAVGGFTAFFAATMGLVATDIKRVLAFSTVSQLGYMMLGIGVGAMTAGMFHLFNHAFFKALLFLCAGSVIHFASTNEIFQMGGLRRWRPVTFVCMVVGALSLAGIPPLSGFWSKDEILAAAASHNAVLYALALATVFMTAFYMFRVVVVAFTGPQRGPAGSPHGHAEPWMMTIPLIVLAIPSIISGWWGSPLLGNPFGLLLEGHEPHLDFRIDTALVSSLLAIGGIGLAWGMYRGGATAPGEALAARFRPVYELLRHRYFVDELYGWIVVRIVLGTAWLCDRIDTRIVDGIVNGTGARTVELGQTLRRVQSGQVRTYAWVLFAGVLALAVLIAVPAVVR